MMELITGAGKKAYTLVMGRPNPAKLANFPEVKFITFLEYTLVCLYVWKLSNSLIFISAMFFYTFLVPKLLCWIAKSI